MSYLHASDRRRVLTSGSTLAPTEVLDIRSPTIRCKSITKFTFDNCDTLEEARYLIDVGREKRSPYRIDRIDPNSIKSARLAVDVIARYFQREFNYGFLQYEANEISDPRDRIYLLTVNRHTHLLGVGAICFRWREWKDASYRLGLAWLWINPFLRRKGILSVYWDAFRNLHGDFFIEQPMSVAMDAFLCKRGECWLCGRECRCESGANSNSQSL